MHSITPLNLVAACFGWAAMLSFAWAGQFLFTFPGGKTRGTHTMFFPAVAVGIIHAAALWWYRCPYAALNLLAIVLYAVSLALFWSATITTRRRPLSFAFSPDTPAHLTTDGPYRYIRHPFYAAYLLAWTTTVLLTGSLWLVPTVWLMRYLYYRAIAAEEAKFAASPLAAAYADYCRTTGRLVPRWTGR